MPDAVIPTPTPTRRPKVWLLADRPGWAYDRMCHGIQAAVRDAFDCRIAYVAAQPDLAAWDYDLVLVCFWGETWHQQFTSDPRRILKLVSSHRWQEQSYGKLTTTEFARRHLADAGTLGATSQRLLQLVSDVRDIQHTPQGVETEHFSPALEATAADRPLTFGWAGNAADPCKGLNDILRPAAHGYVLRTATGDLNNDEMAEFYRSIDVLLVASTLEGEPRTALEAMSAGCFVIATDVGIASELIDNGDNGLIINRTPTAFRAAMHWCDQNRIQVLQAGAANRTRMQTSRTWQSVAPNWLQLLHTAMAAIPQPTTAATPAAVPSAPASPALAALSRRRTTDEEVIERCKQAYHEHFDGLNQPNEDTAVAAAAYYRAELLPLLPPDRGSRILDVGSGYGLLLAFLHEHGYQDLHGIELDAALQQDSVQRLGEHASITQGDAIDYLRANPASFDIITAWDILEHFPLGEAYDFVSAIRAALRPGGKAVLRTPNMANALGIYSRCMDLTHQVGFTEQSAEQLLRLAGFDNIELAVPDFDAEVSLANGTKQSRLFHQQLFALQDRSMPRCFDKNLVLQACAPVDQQCTTSSVRTQPAAPPKPAVVYIVDTPGWAHDHKSNNLIQSLNSRYQGRVIYQDSVTPNDLDSADVVVIWYWKQLQSMAELGEALARNRHKLLMGVCSHNELEGEHQQQGISLLRRLPAQVFTHNELLDREVRAQLPGVTVHCLPNGVDANFYKPTAARRSASPLRVGWAGSLDNFGADMRGVSTVMQPAIAALQSQFPGGFELVIAAREERLRTPAEMRSFYQGLDVYVCASRVEGTPNPALEAAACGVPVISTRVGNMPELIEHGIHGLLIDRTPNALAAALMLVRQRPDLRIAMGQRIRAAIEESWQWQQRCEGFASMFESLLHANQPHRQKPRQRGANITQPQGAV